MSTTTRQRIIEYLQNQRQCTVPEISAALHMTRADMRYHLEHLAAEGVVEVLPRKVVAQGRGRPVQVYRMASTARPHNLVQLADALLSLASEEQLQQAARLLAGEEAMPRAATQRLNHAVQRLNLKRYQARWEAHAQGPRIILRNCPYAALLPEHPELCRMDAAQLEYLVGSPMEQQARIDQMDAHPPACVFVLRARATED